MNEYLTDVGGHTIHIDTIKDDLAYALLDVIEKQTYLYEHDFDDKFFHDCLDKALNHPER